MIHAALKALVARRRRADVDAAYEAYDRHPLDEPDEWGGILLPSMPLTAGRRQSWPQKLVGP